jgi:hypothetical protein
MRPLAALAVLVALALSVLSSAAAQAQPAGPPTPTAASSYIPQAIDIGPYATYGVIGAPLGANGGVDTSHLVLAFWLRCNAATKASASAAGQDFYTCYLNDRFSNYCASPAFDSEACPGLDIVYDNAVAHGTLRINLSAADATTASPHGVQLQFNGLAPALNGRWRHWVLIADTGLPEGAKRAALYIDGVRQKPSGRGIRETPAGGPFRIALNQPGGWALLSRDNRTVRPGHMQLADVILDSRSVAAPGCERFGDEANHLIDRAGEACPALLARLYRGGPVDPGPNCAGPTGHADVCLSGGAASGADLAQGFLKQRGAAAGAFALVNPIPNGLDPPRIWDAPCRPPAACPATPYPEWAVSARSTGLSGADTGFVGDGVIGNQGQPVAPGRLLLLQVTITDSGAAAGRHIACRTGAKAWTALFNVATSGREPGTYAVFYKLADATDATPSGADMANPPVCTWDGGAPARSATYLLSAWANVSAARPVQAIGAPAATGAPVTALIAPAVGATAPATVVNLAAVWDSGQSAAPPRGLTLVHRHYAAAGNPVANNQLSYRALPSPAPATPQATTLSAPAAGFTASLVLQP